MDGYEVCRRAARGPRDAVPARRHDHGERRPGEGRGDRGGRGRLHHEAVRPGRARSRASRSLLRIKRYHDTIEAQAAELAEWNRELEQRVTEQVEQLERLGRLRRFLSPQVAELVVSSGDDSFLESHRREITVVFCDLRGFTAFAETVEPEDVMVVLAEYHGARRRPRPPLRGHARAVHRRRHHGLLQRPDPVRGRAAAGGADGRRDAHPRRPARRGLAPQGLRPRASASASPRATRRSGGSASRAAPTTRRSAASRTSPRGCAPRPRRARSSSASASTRRPRTWSSPTRSGS